MRRKYELIDHDDRLPMKVFLHDVLRSPRHWHRDIEILLVLRGSVAVVLDAERIVLGPEELCVVNSCQVHHVEGLEDNLSLVLQLDPGFLDDRSPGFRGLRFSPAPAGPDAGWISAELRRAIAELMGAVSRREAGYLTLAYGWIFRVAHLLETGCVDSSSAPRLAEGAEGRLRKIAEYIDDHACGEIDLGGIASFAALSPQYLSRYFSGHMGVTITKYIASIRARNSLELLESGRGSVTDIALECGFPNLKAYYAAFRENYGMTPGAYRENLRGRAGAEPRPFGPAGDRPVFDYLAINPDAGLAALSAFFAKAGASAPSPPPPAADEVTLRLDAREAGGEFPRDASPMAAFGRAAEWRHPEWRRQFELLRLETGFEYVRFHGIFDDAMAMVGRGADGSLSFDFGEADGLFDFLLASGAKPFLELGFMPEALASGRRTLFSWKANVSPPRSMADWRSLVAAFVSHLAERYGREELRRWFFEIWNEPDMEGIFWLGGRRDFFDFFADTFEVLKGFDSELKVGGCGFTHWNLLHGSWFGEFTDYCRERGLRPDFLSYHLYPLDIALPGPEADFAEFLDLDKPEALGLRPGFGIRYGGENEPRSVMEKVGALVEEGWFAGTPLYVTEWNSSPIFGDSAHDTAFMGPFAARNLLAGAGLASGRAWWVFSDIFEEREDEGDEFHGGFGLATRSGIRKPSWQAFRLCHRLEGPPGTRLLGRGEAWAASLDPRGAIRLLLWNYAHYTHPELGSAAAPSPRADPYEAFAREPDLRFRIEFPGLAEAKAAKIWRLGRESGSAFDAWVGMGRPERLDEEARAALERASEPSLKLERLAPRSGASLCLTLAPHDLVLVELNPDA